MGTRSTTMVFDGPPDQEHLLLVMYRQMDGYLSGHGHELASFLDGITMVNGLSIGKPERVANGMGCLAAQLVAFFKEEPGGIYIQNPKIDHTEEYNYLLYLRGEMSLRVRVVIGYSGESIFDGTVPEYLDWLKNRGDD